MKKNVRNICIGIVFFIMIFILLLSCQMIKLPNNLDELWNYNTARCIKNGLIPYKDISMITTPLLPFLVGLFLKITVDQLFVFRILEALLITAILIVSFLILKKAKVNGFIGLILVSFSTFILYDETFLDYNFLCLLLLLVIEYLELIKHNDGKKLDLIIGILGGLAICTKHTIGTFICIYIVLSEFVLMKKGFFKETLKNAGIRVIGILIPSVIFLIYLLCTKSFMDFVNYAILGIRTFSNSIKYTELFTADSFWVRKLSRILPILFVVLIVFLIINRIVSSIRKKEQSTIMGNLTILTISSLPMLIALYPISDPTHFLVAVLPLIITMEYVVYLILKLIYDKIKFKLKDFILIVLIAFVLLNISRLIINEIWINAQNYLKNYNSNNVINHFDNIILPESKKERIDILRKFYEEKEQEGYKVIIVDAEACSNTIPLDVYNKNYDMFLKGNIGKDGEDGIINDINESHNTIYLLKNKKYSINWQSPTKVIDFIRDNLDYVGDYDMFEVFYKD